MISLALIASSDISSRSNPTHLPQAHLFLEKTAQCLLLGHYTRPQAYVLETLSHYVYAEMALRSDAHDDIWFLHGLVVHTALRMGYHRDPSHFPGIAPLQAEMRRRAWVGVLQGDALNSGQMGMSRRIGKGTWDAREPRNLDDGDLVEGMSELPPGRPETEVTTATGLIARRRMFVALGEVSDITSAVQSAPYLEIMRVDKVLHDALANIPPPLQPRPLASSMTDPQERIMARLFLSHLFHRGRIMLHRRFLHSLDDAYKYSRHAIIDAAIETLRIHRVLEEETVPGGLLDRMRYRLSSVMKHAFLTATMVLCAVVARNGKQGSERLEREEEVKETLVQAREVWRRTSERVSEEARKAVETVGWVLARAERHGDDLGVGRSQDSFADMVGESNQEGGLESWMTDGSAALFNGEYFPSLLSPFYYTTASLY
jgi:hypothetical protein